MSGFGAAASLANFPLPSLPLDFRLLGPMLGPLPQAYDFEPLRGQPTHCKNPSQRVHQQTLPERHEFPGIGRKKFCWHQRLWILLTINDLSWVSNFKGECHQLPLEMMRIRYTKVTDSTYNQSPLDMMGTQYQKVTDYTYDQSPLAPLDMMGIKYPKVTDSTYNQSPFRVRYWFYLQSVTFGRL